MSRYVIVIKNTDRSNPDYEFLYRSSLSSVTKYVRNFRTKNKDECFAFPGAANTDLPISQQNFHKRVCNTYEVCPGISLKREAAKIAKKDSPYDRNHTVTGSYIMSAICRHCTYIEIGE